MISDFRGPAQEPGSGTFSLLSLHPSLSEPPPLTFPEKSLHPEQHGSYNSSICPDKSNCLERTQFVLGLELLHIEKQDTFPKKILGLNDSCWTWHLLPKSLDPANFLLSSFPPPPSLSPAFTEQPLMRQDGRASAQPFLREPSLHSSMFCNPK